MNRSAESELYNVCLQGGDLIASKDIGLVLRILGQNPTKDQIVEMVMKVSRILVRYSGYSRTLQRIRLLR